MNIIKPHRSRISSLIAIQLGMTGAPPHALIYAPRPIKPPAVRGLAVDRMVKPPPCNGVRAHIINRHRFCELGSVQLGDVIVLPGQVSYVWTVSAAGKWVSTTFQRLSVVQQIVAREAGARPHAKPIKKLGLGVSLQQLSSSMAEFARALGGLPKIRL